MAAPIGSMTTSAANDTRGMYVYNLYITKFTEIFFQNFLTYYSRTIARIIQLKPGRFIQHCPVSNSYLFL